MFVKIVCLVFNMKRNKWASRVATKSKMHPTYQQYFSENKVIGLRMMAKLAGEKKWYKLRKASLVNSIVVNNSAKLVTKVFRQYITNKRLQVFHTHQQNASQCPISLVLISDLEQDDIFIHEGVVFSKTAMLDYINVSVDFTNPITRSALHLHDIERLGDNSVVDKFKHRETLRHERIKSINNFAFLELELDNVFRNVIQNYYFQGAFYTHNLLAFKKMWKEMKSLDRNRTICVLKSLEDCVNRFSGESHTWGKAFLQSYLQKT